KLRSELRRQRRLRPVHRPLRVFDAVTAVRMAPRHQLVDGLRPREGGALAHHRGAQPGHQGVHEPRRQADPVPRLERLGRAAGWIARLLLRADAVREAAAPARPRLRQAGREALAPGRGRHCAGGTGPNAIGGGAPEPTAVLRNAEHHVVSAVIKWVEEGVAPEKIVASRIVSGAVVRQRPVCPYPAQAAYNGSGSIDDAANFSCVTPKLQERTISSTDILLIQNSLRQRDLKLPNR